MTIEAMAAAITVEGLTKRYGELTAVDDLSFSVRPGAVTGFLGPNGAGKTTALKAIVGHCPPDRRSRAHQRHADRVGARRRPHARRLHRADAARIPAARRAIICARSRRWPGCRAAASTRCSRSSGSSDAAGRRVGKYSTGMRQRLGLASALLGDPEILVLDEPLNGLDPQGIRWLRTLLRERAASGGTVLLSSHVLTEAAQTVDDVVVIHKGRLVHQGAIGELTGLGGGARGRAHAHARAARHCRTRTPAGGCELQNGGGRLLIEGLDAAAGGRARPRRARRPARACRRRRRRSSRCSSV